MTKKGNDKDKDKDKDNTLTIRKTNTFREHLQRAT